MVIAGTVAHYKIRWARVDYNKKEHGYNYFSFPNSSVTAFPGYVYHCHFLDHEDNEMMRPIMLV
jgi:spore coat protein A